jgi:hypothetical protein
MQRVCHRCHADLPGEAYGHGSGVSASDLDRALFCPRCGAPQIQLPSYMRSEPETSVTGTADPAGPMPPARPQLVEWPVVLGCAAPVGLATAAFAIAGIFNPGGFFVVTLCILCGSSIVLGLYRARRPLARVDGRVGLRVGAAAGLLMIALTWTALAITGVVERYGVHGMSAYDELLTKQQQAAEQMTEGLLGPEIDAATRKDQLDKLSTPEFRVAGQLMGIFLQSGLVLVLTTGLGGFAGLLQSRRASRRLF